MISANPLALFLPPAHFDAFHAVVVDTSIHISLLKGSYHTSQQKVSGFVRLPVFEVQTSHYTISV